MKILLTGANGFVGSHLLERLLGAGHELTLLLRPTSDVRFIAEHLSRVKVVRGGLSDPEALAKAVREATLVLHCAGATKAVREEGLFSANQQGTRNLVAAANARGGQVRRFVHISSLAAGRPGTRRDAARENDPSSPRSAYGRSKLAAEQEVRTRCASAWTILRPAAVMGPRDREFLPLFRAARFGWAPLFGGGRQELSLVLVQDLARVVEAVLESEATCGQVFNVAGPEILTARELVGAIGEALGRRPRGIRLPWWTLRSLCGLAATGARLTGRATVLAHGKYGELSAPGWVADRSRLCEVIGDAWGSSLAEGLRETAVWYRENGWL